MWGRAAEGESLYVGYGWVHGGGGTGLVQFPCVWLSPPSDMVITAGLPRFFASFTAQSSEAMNIELDASPSQLRP